jgi:hypothetical protein
MKTNPDASAFPLPASIAPVASGFQTPAQLMAAFEPESGGLTKREYFAALAMQGLTSFASPLTVYERVNRAVEYADALIDELNKD